MRASTAPARESWCSKPSWPGTNSRVMTRDGSAASRWGLRVTSPACTEVIAAQSRSAARAASVESTASVDSAPWLRFTPSACRPSNPPPVSGSHMSCPRVVVALEPGRRGPDAVGPDRTGVDGGGAGARVGEGGHLDRLLIERRAERRPARCPRPVSARGGRRPSRSRAARPADPGRVGTAPGGRARCRRRSSPRARTALA